MVSMLVCLAREEVQPAIIYVDFFPCHHLFLALLGRLLKPFINHQRVVDSWFGDRQPMGLTHYPLIIFFESCFSLIIDICIIVVMLIQLL